jgi:hypothetical protein
VSAVVLEAVRLVDVGDVIDLGDLWRNDETYAPSTPWRLSRVSAALLLVCLCLVTLGGLAPTHDGPLWTQNWPADITMSAGGTAVYVVERGSAPMVTAMDARTGQRLWRLRIARTPFQVVDVGYGVDALLFHPTNEPSDDYGDSSVLMDRGTGQVLGTYPGVPQLRAGAILVMQQRLTHCWPTDGACVDVTGVPVGASEPAWRLRLPAGGRLIDSWNGSGQRFLTAGADGSLTVRDVATGMPLANAPGTLTSGSGLRLAAVVDGLLIVGRPDADASELYAYDEATLAPRWSERIVRDAGDYSPEVGLVELAACGHLLCLRDGGGSTILEPASGAVRFHTDLTVLAQVGAGVLAAATRLGGWASDLVALDARTGEVLQTAPDATLVTESAVIAGAPAPTGGPLVQVWGERRTGFARMDASGRLTLLFSVDDVGLHCVQGRDSVSCLASTGTVRSWPLAGPAPGQSESG